MRAHKEEIKSQVNISQLKIDIYYSYKQIPRPEPEFNRNPPNKMKKKSCYFLYIWTRRQQMALSGQTVKLQPSDSQDALIEVSLEVANQSITIKNMLEGRDNNNNILIITRAKY